MSDPSTTLATPGTLWGTMGRLKDWIDENGVMLDASQAKVKETHMSFVGGPYGRLHIPDELHESWLRAYADEMSRNQHSVFFCERRTPVFRMHFDLDFVQATAVEPEYVHQMTTAATDVFRDFFPELAADAEEWLAVVLKTSPKPTKRSDGTGGIVKTGFHVIWPYLCVDKAMALQLRLNFVAKLERDWAKRVGDSNSYDDVVDKLVLTSNGLRMYGSDKAAKCKPCRGSHRASTSCTICQGRGVLVENRSYRLDHILSPDGSHDAVRCREWLADPHTCIRFTTTRLAQKVPTPGFKVPSYAITNATIRKAKAGGGGGGGGGQGINGPPNSELVDATSPVYRHIKEFIANAMGVAEWREIDVVRVFLNRTQGYICHVNGPGSCYCRNVSRAHGTSTIYFSITPIGVTQGCYSPKGTSRCTCRNYRRSPTQPETHLTNWLKTALFGVKPAASTTATAPPIPDSLRGGEGYHEIRRKRKATSPLPHHKQHNAPVTLLPLTGAHTPHPDYPGMSVAEVAAIPARKLREVQLRCMQKLPDPCDVHRKIVGDGVPLPPMVNPKRRRT